MAEHMDMETLRAFSVVAGELNLRRAAELLHISQPPLSRKIKNFENSLGVSLFVRHSYGLELTVEGKAALTIVKPLLLMHRNAQESLARLKHAQSCAIGFSTAFEQNIFEPVLAEIESCHAGGISVKRSSSPQLAREVLKGNLLAAWVALPIGVAELGMLKLPWADPLLAMIPEQWNIFDANINLRDLEDRPFFWFPASRNPYWHRRMKEVFGRLAFKPEFIEEPPEYDVLLSRIASGEGWALIPASFRAIQRRGIKFVGIRDLPPLEMGIIYKNPAGKLLAQKCANCLPGYGSR